MWAALRGVPAVWLWHTAIAEQPTQYCAVARQQVAMLLRADSSAASDLWADVLTGVFMT